MVRRRASLGPICLAEDNSLSVLQPSNVTGSLSVWLLGYGFYEPLAQMVSRVTMLYRLLWALLGVLIHVIL